MHKRFIFPVVLPSSPMLRCVANYMNKWEIFPSLLIGTSIYIYVLLLLATFWQHSVTWEKMHFTWFSRRDGFSPTRHQINTASSWEKTPSLLENHVKCISSTCFQVHLPISGKHLLRGPLMMAHLFRGPLAHLFRDR